LERIQAVLDRAQPASILNEEHALACAACRDRVSAALRMLELFAEPVRVRPGFADAVLAEVAHDSKVRFRRKVAAVFGGFALAASIAVAFWMNQPKEPGFVKQDPPPVQHEPAPVPPIRVNDELAKATEAFRESTRPITEPVAEAPRVVAALTDTLFKTPALPVGHDFATAGQSIADIPDAAKSGLEPVGSTAQKALNRLLRDVTGMKPKT
jgi:hypothetical protein